MKNLILFLVLILSAHAGSAIAKDLDDLKRAWKNYQDECSLALAEPAKFRSGEIGRDGKITTSESEDQQFNAFVKRSGDIYVELFVEKLPDREVRRCHSTLEYGGAINTHKFAKIVTDWLSSKDNLRFAGGSQTIYTPNNYKFLVLGVFPEYDIVTRLGIIDYGIQLHAERVIR